MLNITGPPVISPQQRPEDSALTLRLNQRIVAEVLQVSGDNVMLALDGIRFVARLNSPEQLVALVDRRYAQFIVKDINPNQILLQLAPAVTGSMVAGTGATRDVSAELLVQMGLPVNENNLMLLRQMLGRGLPADSSIFLEIQDVLKNLGNWGAPEAQVAAALKAAGLPLTTASLSLSLQASVETAQAYGRLLNLLQNLTGRQLSPQVAEALQRALATMSDASTEWTGNSSAMAESLRQAVALLGRSVEFDLAEGILKGNPSLLLPEDNRSLLSLLVLRRELARSGPREVVEAIDRYLETLRLHQFQSSQPEPAPGRSEWINLHLPLHLAPGQTPIYQQNRQSFHEASLRIACNGHGEDERRVESGFTRLVVAVDLDDQNVIEVDLSVVEHQIGMQVMASSSGLCDLAKEELSLFSQGLKELGFDLQTARFEVGQPGKRTDRSGSTIAPTQFLAIDLEV